jgi:pentatricopeptide repeat protein
MIDNSILFVSNIYVSLLQHYANMKALSKGKQIHGHMLVTDFDQRVSTCILLVSMYATHGSMADTRLFFDILSKPRKALLWNVMTRGYAMHGNREEAIELYYKIKFAGTEPYNITFPIVLKACAKLSALQKGMEIHGLVIKRGFDSNVFTRTTLLTMYWK